MDEPEDGAPDPTTGRQPHRMTGEAEAGPSTSDPTPTPNFPDSILPITTDNDAILRAAAEIRARRSMRVPAAQAEPPRKRTNWDHLLQEMVWMATEFRAERKVKLRVLKNVAAKAARSKFDVAGREEARSCPLFTLPFVATWKCVN
jgi:hypothetical protein